MAVSNLSKKHLAIDKSNAQMIVIVSVAAFVTIFCLVAAQAILSQNNYQARVIKAKTAAHQQLQANLSAFSQLSSTYNDFNDKPINLLGGSSSGAGQNQGPNSQLVHDALPSSYDFPALASSLEKILTNGNFTVSSITGTDEQLSQQSNISSATPQPVAMPFSFSVTDANYASIAQLITTLGESIRPIQIDSLTLSGGNSNMQMNVTAHTYYQPATKVTITKKEVQ